MNDDLEDDEDSLPLRELERLWGGACQACRRGYSGYEAIFSIALGFKNAPRCLPCLAQGLNRDAVELREQLVDYVQKRECFRRAWRVAEEREQASPQPVPTCLNQTVSPPTQPPEPLPPPLETDEAIWDAGDMGCGELVLALRIRLNKMPAGSVLRVIAQDPAAPEDLPAWCRMTGHTLIDHAHPTYRIRRKES
jgi:tRNA 2-thiouridine synthesizing protein A